MKVAGIHPIEELLKSKLHVSEVFVKDPVPPRVAALVKSFQQRKVPVKKVPAKKLDKIYKGVHQGIVAVISAVEYADFENLVDEAFRRHSKPVFLLLDGITDARNFGAILRSAVAFEADGIIVPAHHTAPLNDDVAKISTGALFHIPVARVNHLADAVFFLQTRGVEVVASAGQAKKALETYTFRSAVALIMGNEQKGISQRLLKLADTRLKISISPRMESLNVSAATAVFLYEIHRQLRILQD